MARLPHAVHDALGADLAQLDDVIQALATEEELPARAILAEELVRLVSVLTDTEERALYPFLAEHGHVARADRLRASCETLRAAVDPVFVEIRHSSPIEVHQADPDRVERAIGSLIRAVDAHLALERRELAAVESELEEGDPPSLEERLVHERRGAVGRPHPARNPVARAIQRVLQRVDRPDSAEEYRPARAQRRKATGQGERRRAS